ncbi:MAG: hypothetical protein H0T08_06850 [Acidobacteria bacterium]|nr:hypothetical protein [Acidobacteriota bacterium]
MADGEMPVYRAMPDAKGTITNMQGKRLGQKCSNGLRKTGQSETID